MPRKPKFDANAAFNSIIVPSEGTTTGDDDGTKAVTLSTEPPRNKEAVNVKEVPQEKEKLVQKAYYITQERYRALKVRAAMMDVDMSQIVREALDRYLWGAIDLQKNMDEGNISYQMKKEPWS